MGRYYYADGQRIAMRYGSTVYYLLGDHLGSTTLTVTGSGAKYAEQRYYPWGDTRYTYWKTPTAYQFTGQYQDYYIKLYHMGARMYDPELGRFISPDSIVPDFSNPQSLNRYAYVVNNPLKYRDPTGHWPEWADFAAGVVTQFGRDMLFFIPPQVWEVQDALVVAVSAEIPSVAYDEGREAGRNLSRAVATAMLLDGGSKVLTGLAAMGPTGGSGVACALATGGMCAIPAGAALAGEGALVAGGALEIGYGSGMLVYAKLNPLAKAEGGNRYTTNKRLVMQKFDLSKRDFNRSIHDIKKYIEGNPDVIFDLETGDVLDQRSGEVIGNLLDYISH